MPGKQLSIKGWAHAKCKPAPRKLQGIKQVGTTYSAAMDVDDMEEDSIMDANVDTSMSDSISNFGDCTFNEIASNDDHILLVLVCLLSNR
jgi:hypothetical protein